MTSRTLKNTRARNRRAMDPSVPATMAPAVITSATTPGEDTVSLVFDTPVMVTRIPPTFRAGAGGTAEVVSITAVSATEVSLTFSGEVAGTTLFVGAADPGIRTSSGGFVPAGQYALLNG